MHFTFVGCGDAFGSGGRLNTCFHIRAARTTFLIDCGASSLIGMNRFGVDRNAVDTILGHALSRGSFRRHPVLHARRPVQHQADPPPDDRGAARLA